MVIKADFTDIWIVLFFMRIHVAECLAKGSFYCPKFVIEGALYTYIKQVAKKCTHLLVSPVIILYNQIIAPSR